MIPFFLGANSFIHIKNGWEECCLLWFLIGADKGHGKTPVYRYFYNQMLLLKDRREDINCDFIDSFTIEALYHNLSKEANEGRMLIFLDEFSKFINQINSKKGDGTERATFLSLINGIGFLDV